MRYIEIDSIIEQIKAEHCERCKHDERCALCDIDEVLLLLEEADDADVEEVKHGYWIDKPTGRYSHMGSWCSVCGNKSGIGGIESNRHKPYCPNCGATMDERNGE